jgi:hypothetical protein
MTQTQKIYSFDSVNHWRHDENVVYITKEVTPELIDRILEQQEKNMARFEHTISERPIRIPQEFLDFVATNKISTNLKINWELIGEAAVFMQFIHKPLYCWGFEEPLHCLRQIGENPDEYDIGELYEKVMEKYYKTHMIAPQVNFSSFDQVESYTKRLLTEAERYFRSKLEAAQSDPVDT